MYKEMHNLLCPIKNGGCGNDNFITTIDRKNKRIILDCPKCEYRISLPLNLDKLNNIFTGPLDENGKETIS